MQSLQFLFLLVLCTCTALNGLSQNTDAKQSKNSFLIGIAFSPVVSELRPGVHIEFRRNITDKYFTGLYFLANSVNTRDSFGFIAKEPIVNVTETGWLNGVHFYESSLIRLSVSLANNLTIVRLGDNSEKTTTFTGRVLVSSTKEIRTNYEYSMVPGAEAMVHIRSTLFLAANLKYRQAFGTSFAGNKSINGFIYGLGLVFFFE
jgi:hypothetical protein